MNVEPIASIESPFKEKFGIPRQPGLVSYHSFVRFIPPYNHENYIRGLEAFSHIWILWQFHENEVGKHTATVRPPRLGGNERLGVFATRSSFRPNSLAISVVELLSIEQDKQGCFLKIQGGDFVHGTPVFDIKPYVAFVDCIENTRCGYAEEKPEPVLSVHFADQVLDDLKAGMEAYPDLKELIVSVLSYDPRPAYKQKSQDEGTYGVSIYDLNIRWLACGNQAIVVGIDQT